MLLLLGVIALVVFLAFGIPGLIVGGVIAGIVVGLIACCGGKEK